MRAQFKVKMDSPLALAVHPHMHSVQTVSRRVWGVCVALIPIVVASASIFGWSAMRILGISILSAMGFEWLFQVLMRRRVQLLNGHAIFVGALFAFLLPTSTPAWVVLAGVFVGVVVAKELCGGLGENYFHPSLLAYVVVAAFFPTFFPPPAATSQFVEVEFLLGHTNGSLGTTSLIALVVAGTILIATRRVRIEPLFFYFLTLSATASMLGPEALRAFGSGPTFLLGFFAFSDSATTPVTRIGRIAFSVGAGALAVVFFALTAHVLVSLTSALLLMNVLVRPIDYLFGLVLNLR
jgi:Na+-translocating ferredoxin:NAD+ oxidoreductase subunit D